MPGHIPLLGVLAEEGEVRIRTGEQTVTAEVHGGFVSVTNDGVSILAEQANIS
jgi:F-type H+-transporting ATPase subunit epsilon